MKDVLQFMADLAQNNNREWFQANKPRYEKTKKQFLSTVQEIIEILQFDDQRLNTLNSKDAMFRIFRDVRFSNDKSPYKTHYGAYMARGGRKSREAGYYLHVGSDEMFIAAGVHSPEKDDLNAIRNEILFQPEKYASLLKEKLAKGYSTYEKDKLVNGPVGFPKDSPSIEYLKYKHHLLSHPLGKEDLLSDDAAIRIAGLFRELVPETEFINPALEFKGNE